ncbi:uncharacterized protein BdWA1_004058 [Babesia duncani]|nr:hypothetical protein BdWA1_004058 [Babesia duncani]
MSQKAPLGLQNIVSSIPFNICPYYPHEPDHTKLDSIDVCKITKLGRCLSLIPMESRFAKAIYCILCRTDQIQWGLLIVSAMSFGGGALISPASKGIKSMPRFKDDVEALSWMCFNYIKLNKGTGNSDFCQEYGINAKALKEVILQAQQIYNIVRINFAHILDIKQLDWQMDILEPSLDQLKLIKEALVECLIDKVSILSNNEYISSEMPNGVNAVHLPVMYSKLKPKMIVYNYLIETQDRIRMQDIIETDEANLSILKSPLVVSKEFIKDPKPVYCLQTDNVHAYVKKWYSPLNIELHVTRISVGNRHPLAIKTFAQHFCFGLVYEELLKFKKFLNVTWDAFLKPIPQKSNLARMIALFVSYGISSKKAFEKNFDKINSRLGQDYGNLLTNEVDKRDVNETISNLNVNFK